MHDTALREGDFEHPMPLGYDTFAAYFNGDRNSRDETIRFALLAKNGSCCTTSQFAPSLQDILRVHEVRLRKEEDKTGGGIWYSKDRVDLVDELVWDYLARS